nr:hypothetical protein [Mycobacteroides abscessus]
MALCDILDCAVNDLFEPFMEMRAAPGDIGVTPGQPIASAERAVNAPLSSPRGQVKLATPLRG